MNRWIKCWMTLTLSTKVPLCSRLIRIPNSSAIWIISSCSQLTWNGFSPVWTSWCRFSFELSTNDFPHSAQMCTRGPWVCRCLRIAALSRNNLLQPYNSNRTSHIHIVSVLEHVLRVCSKYKTKGKRYSHNSQLSRILFQWNISMDCAISTFRLSCIRFGHHIPHHIQTNLCWIISALYKHGQLRILEI